MIMHSRFHGSLNPFVCSDCGATFPRKFQLVNHGRIHGRVPHSCTVCGKEFLQKRTLVAHMRLYILINHVFCSALSHLFHHFSFNLFTTFLRLFYLMRFDSSLHRLTFPFYSLDIFTCHFPSLILTLALVFPVIYSQFILNIFKFKFTNSWDYFGLVPSNSPIHRLHTGDQPYPCTACGEGFRTKAELNQHNRATHGGINPNSANTTIVVSGSQQQQMVSNILRIRIRTISNIISVFDE